jgi:hypothetical protein
VHEECDERWLASVIGAVTRGAQEPADQLITVFEVLAEQLEAGAVETCPLLPPQHCRLWSYLAGLALEAGLEAPDRVAEQLLLLIDGIFAAAQRSEGANAARTAGQIAASIVDARRRS